MVFTFLQNFTGELMQATDIYVEFRGPTARYHALLLDMAARGVIPGAVVPKCLRVHRCALSEKNPDSVDLTVSNGGSPIDTESIRRYLAEHYRGEIVVNVFNHEDVPDP